LKYTAPGTEPVEDIGYLTPKSYVETTVVPIQSPNEFHKFFILLKLYYIQLYRDWVSDTKSTFCVKGIKLQIILAYL
jgi:hypothetical protein